MKRFTIAALALALCATTLGHASPASAGPRCGFHRHWVPGHRGFHGHWIPGHCV